MNLASRISRMEGSQRAAAQRFEIDAADKWSVRRFIEDALLSSVPGPITISGTVAGEAFEETMILGSHEDRLERLK